jgi:hypothetical protein
VFIPFPGGSQHSLPLLLYPLFSLLIGH